MDIFEDKVVKVKIKVSSCLKCGSDDITIYDCGYSSFNVGGGKCNKCGNEVSDTVDCLPSKKRLVSIWNSKNDLDFLINNKELEIEKNKKELEELKSKKENR